jgi:S1/P1 Nuclease
MPHRNGKRLAALALASALVCLLPARAAAWGGEGHRMVAQIALWRLTRLRDAGDARAGRALRRVSEILASQPETEMAFRPRTIEEAALWPDRVRRKVAEYSFANDMHFVSIPVDATVDQDRLDRAAVCPPVPRVPEGRCVVGGVEHFAAALGAEGATRKARLEALSFLVHFVGDLHQPLHASENPLAGGRPDRGGNNRLVFYLDRALFNDPRKNSCFAKSAVCVDFFGRDRASKNLHATWDKYMIQTEMALNASRKTEPKYVADLVRTLPADASAARYSEIEAGTPAEWAEAAHDLAEKNAYRLPGPRRKISPADGDEHDFYLVSQTYRADNVRLVNRQLLNAGLRLSALLRQSLGR